MTGRVPLGEAVRRDAEERRVRAAEVRVLVLGRLPALVGEWPEPWRSSFEERAGIVEFMGRRSRAAAETAAEAMVRHRLGHR